MQVFISIIVFASSSVLIISVLLQEGKNAGMGAAVGGAAVEKMFGKGKARGFQAFLQRITIISAVVFGVSTLIMGIFLQG